jgi:hypothetical protein
MSFRHTLASALGLHEAASDDDIARALADHMLAGRDQAPRASVRLTDDPQQAFHELAQQTAKVLGISLSDAYSRVSAEAPILYERAAAKASLN